MSIDSATVTKIAHLARLKVDDADKPLLATELSGILDFVAQLDEVDVKGVAPMTSTHAMSLRQRDDVVTDGGKAEAILSNAPQRTGDFFVVPKVVE
ncbi:MAG: Asp-tRNA(Asn)/Glu-tRNA(Gln) amidotransferase subunit GatC [Alphaproteobacteria bacterium]|nr:Asp-tRNA(Asn)/Glu-tRNA(Gln) amidotransferase subunit GatC [Alphaproteobacteria bacterium]